MVGSKMLVKCLGVCLMASVAVFAQDAAAPAADATPVADAATRSAPGGGANPQTRFLPGVGNLLSNIFNPCSRCNAGDQELASRCCQTGRRECCFALQQTFPGQFGNGFNHGFGQGFQGQGQFGNGFNQGFNPGFQTGFHQNQGFQGGFNQGFRPGSHGGFQQGFNNAQTNIKPGFCPRQGLFRSGAVNNPAAPGLRSAVAPTGAVNSPVASPAPATPPQLGRGNRRARQAPDASASAGAPADGPANTRFLNLFGPGPIINNPFCRDECFNDRDCLGNLKCCLRDCRKCTNPSFF